MKTSTWFETLIEEQDVDIMAWAIGTLPVPAAFAGPQMDGDAASSISSTSHAEPDTRQLNLMDTISSRYWQRIAR